MSPCGASANSYWRVSLASASGYECPLPLLIFHTSNDNGMVGPTPLQLGSTGHKREVDIFGTRFGPQLLSIGHEIGGALRSLLPRRKAGILWMSGLFDLEHFISGLGSAIPLREALHLCASMKRDDFVSPHVLFDYDFYRHKARQLAAGENPLVGFLTN